MTIKVLVVDDSALMRKLLTDILKSDPEIEVMGSASDPYVAREMIAKQRPDVITLDIEMPRMDGITFLKKLMVHYPIPTIIISSLSEEGSEMALEAIEAGAVDVITKPKVNVLNGIEEIAFQIIEKVKGAARSKNIKNFTMKALIDRKKETKGQSMTKTTDKIVAIGASTGGPEAVYRIIEKLPYNFLPVIIVIHMPAGFTKSYAKRLNASCRVEVKEAEDGDKLYRGRVLIAPGDYQMYLRRSGSYYYVDVKQDSIYKHHRPAVDPMFFSVAEYAGKNSIGVILTGMGKDGAEGMLKMKENGAFNYGQDEKSSIVYGMPKVAFEIGAVDKVMDLDKIAEELIKLAD